MIALMEMAVQTKIEIYMKMEMAMGRWGQERGDVGGFEKSEKQTLS